MSEEKKMEEHPDAVELRELAYACRIDGHARKADALTRIADNIARRPPSPVGRDLGGSPSGLGGPSSTPSDAERAVARALWEDWRKGKTAKQIHRDTSWDELLEAAKTRPLIQHMIDDGHSQARAAIAAMAAASPSPWRSMESAPKDGTDIDVWVGGEFPRRVSNVQWREPTDSEWWVHGGDSLKTPKADWFDAFGPLSKREQPIAWQPLPSPPSEGELAQPITASRSPASERSAT